MDLEGIKVEFTDGAKLKLLEKIAEMSNEIKALQQEIADIKSQLRTLTLHDRLRPGSPMK